MRWVEAAVGAVLLTASGIAISRALELGLLGSDGPDPGLFSFCLGIALALTTAVWLVQSAVRRRAAVSASEPASELASGPGEAASLPDRSGLARIGAVVAAQAGFVLVLPWLGFRLTCAIFLLTLAGVVGERRWKIAVPVALLFSLGSYHVFVAWLEVPLPGPALLSLL